MVSNSSCLQYAEVTVTIALLPYFIWAGSLSSGGCSPYSSDGESALAFSALRTYALCERHVGLGLGILVFLLSSVTIGINLVSGMMLCSFICCPLIFTLWKSRYHWLGSAIIPTLGCFPDYPLSEELDKK